MVAIANNSILRITSYYAIVHTELCTVHHITVQVCLCSWYCLFVNYQLFILYLTRSN